MCIKSLMALVGCLLGLTATASAGAPVTLVEKGKPAATIVIADQPADVPSGKPPAVVYAAEELQSFIEKASGAKMRLHLKGVAAPDVASLSRGLWGAES